jgi:hypothetical protein
MGRTVDGIEGGKVLVTVGVVVDAKVAVATIGVEIPEMGREC